MESSFVFAVLTVSSSLNYRSTVRRTSIVISEAWNAALSVDTATGRSEIGCSERQCRVARVRNEAGPDDHCSRRWAHRKESCRFQPLVEGYFP